MKIIRSLFVLKIALRRLHNKKLFDGYYANTIPLYWGGYLGQHPRRVTPDLTNLCLWISWSLKSLKCDLSGL